jgi:hypothetical protein
MKLAVYAWIMVAVGCVAAIPHTVGAMFLETQLIISEKVYPCSAPMTYMKDTAKQIARGKVMVIYQSNHEWKALFKLWSKESRWDYTAKNKHSSAFGIPQMLNMPEDTPMIEQINMGLRYIKHRYGTPSRALAFHNAHGWY